MATSLNIMNVTKVCELAISEPIHCAAAQQSARRMALSLGFAEGVSEELALAVAELTSNLVKHAGHGALVLRPLESEGRTGIEIEASDHGPGIRDVEQSFADGYSTSGSLGYGLGTVNRLMDEMDVNSTPDSGTQIICRRWKRPAHGSVTLRQWDVSVLTRSRWRAQANGDAFVVKQWDGQVLVGLIDGLGHGELAQKAALAAQQYVQTHYDQPLEKIFSGVGRACRATRGVVMALARFSSPEEVQLASIGNIEIRTWTASERISLVVKRGFLGTQESHVRVQELKWNVEWLLVLHTDGLRTHWQWSDFPGIERESAYFVASILMRRLATEQDDATVLAVRRRKP